MLASRQVGCCDLLRRREVRRWGGLHGANTPAGKAPPECLRHTNLPAIGFFVISTAADIVTSNQLNTRNWLSIFFLKV